MKLQKDRFLSHKGATKNVSAFISFIAEHRPLCCKLTQNCFLQISGCRFSCKQLEVFRKFIWSSVRCCPVKPKRTEVKWEKNKDLLLLWGESITSTCVELIHIKPTCSHITQAGTLASSFYLPIIQRSLRFQPSRLLPTVCNKPQLLQFRKWLYEHIIWRGILKDLGYRFIFYRWHTSWACLMDLRLPNSWEHRTLRSCRSLFYVFTLNINLIPWPLCLWADFPSSDNLVANRWAQFGYPTFSLMNGVCLYPVFLM